MIYTGIIGLKPHWWADSLHFSRHSNRKLKTSLPNIFPQLIVLVCHFFMDISYIKLFHISGNVLWIIQFLKIIESVFIMAKSHILMSPFLWALHVLSNLINLMNPFPKTEVKKVYCVICQFYSLVFYYCYLMGSKKISKWFAFILTLTRLDSLRVVFFKLPRLSFIFQVDLI